MRRERIDVAVHAQIDRMDYLLRDVARSGGKDGWRHLFSHGHHHGTIAAAIRQQYLTVTERWRYELTDSGRRRLADIDAEQLRRQGP